MREQLVQYVDLLFAGTIDSEEMKQEILQNTLDRFDDLVAQGKSPEAAYRLSISGIGDINEILGATQNAETQSCPRPITETIQTKTDDNQSKKLRAIGIAMYIICAIPLFILSDLGLESIGLALTILLVAVATYLMIITGKNNPEKDDNQGKSNAKTDIITPQNELKNSINKLSGAVTLAVYLIVSFLTGAWYITWLIFPIFGCIKGLIIAIIDLREASKYES